MSVVGQGLGIDPLVLVGPGVKANIVQDVVSVNVSAPKVKGAIVSDQVTSDAAAFESIGVSIVEDKVSGKAS